MSAFTHDGKVRFDDQQGRADLWGTSPRIREVLGVTRHAVVASPIKVARSCLAGRDAASHEPTNQSVI